MAASAQPAEYSALAGKPEGRQEEGPPRRRAAAAGGLLAAALLLSCGAAEVAAQRKGPELPASAAAATVSTPKPVVGYCSAIWTNHWYKYVMPYDVYWTSGGLFSWRVTFRNASLGDELGRGTIMSVPVTRVHSDGSWTASYHAATTFLPDGNTTCVCQYLSGYPNGEIVYTDYLRANIQGQVHKSVWEVCGAYVAEPCPVDNASALAAIGSPFVEVYSYCTAAGRGLRR